MLEVSQALWILTASLWADEIMESRQMMTTSRPTQNTCWAWDNSGALLIIHGLASFGVKPRQFRGRRSISHLACLIPSQHLQAPLRAWPHFC